MVALQFVGLAHAGKSVMGMDLQLQNLQRFIPLTVGCYINNSVRMEQNNIFISVGATSTKKQEEFVSAIEDRLRSEGLTPNTVGRNKFTADSPLKAINELMDECNGTVIIALERIYFSSGLEKRGGEKESELKEVKIPTTWNQIESAMAYSKGHPLMIIIEEGLRKEGLLERGFDWYILYLTLEKSSLLTVEFNGVFNSWRNKVEKYKKEKNQVKKNINIDTLTIGDLIKGLKMSQLWAILVALAGLIAGAFMLGQFFAQ